MATQSGPKGDWHRTWRAIHHQSHVAISLCVASVSDLCVCECVWMHHMCIHGWGACMCHSIVGACQQKRTIPAQQNRSLSKLQKGFIMFEDHIVVKVTRETFVCSCDVWMTGRPGGQQEVTLGADTERHWNQGTIKLLVRAAGLRPRFVCQTFDCSTFITDREVECTESERKVSCVVNTWQMAYDSVELSQVQRWGLSQGDTRKAPRRWKDGEGKRRRKEAWKSVFIFLITYQPHGIAGMPFYSCSVMNECTRMCSWR